MIHKFDTPMRKTRMHYRYQWHYSLSDLAVRQFVVLVCLLTDTPEVEFSSQRS